MARSLWIQAFCLLAVIRIGLRVSTLSTVRSVLKRLARGPAHLRAGPVPQDSAVVARVVGAVQTAGRWVPEATCLAQALAAQTLLARHGYPSHLHIGVGRDERGKFVAHAWLEWQIVVIIGGSEVNSRYAVMPGGLWESL
jgi:hypothetical protein